MSSIKKSKFDIEKELYETKEQQILQLCQIMININYDKEIYNSMYLCKLFYHDIPLLQGLKSYMMKNYYEKRQHIIQFACMVGNYSRFYFLFRALNHDQIIQLYDRYRNDSLAHLACNIRPAFPNLSTKPEQETRGRYINLTDRLQILRFLFEETTINLNKKNIEGHTPIMIVVMDNQLEMFDFFIHYLNRYDINMKDNYGNSCLDLAASYLNDFSLLMVQKLCSIKSYKIHTKNIDYTTPIHTAKKFGNMKIVQELLPYFPSFIMEEETETNPNNENTDKINPDSTNSKPNSSNNNDITISYQESNVFNNNDK